MSCTSTTMTLTVRPSRRGHCALALCLAITQPVFSSALSQAGGRSAQASARCGSGWVVRSISARPDDAFAGHAPLGTPSAALGASGLYVVGRVMPTAAFDTGEPSALMTGPDGKVFPLPAGAERGEAFRIAVAAPDSIYLLWGVSNPAVDTARRGRELPTEVWFSSRSRGKGWGAPTRLFTALRVGWDNAQVSEVVRDGQGAFHVAFSAERDWGKATLVHVTMRHGSASLATTELRSGAGYVTAVPTPSGMLFAFVAPDLVKAHNANSVFVIDADETGFLPPARLVMSSPGEEQAIALRAVSTANEAIHLVWLERRGADAGPLLRHTLSRDGGRQWSPWTDVAYVGAPQITAVPDGRGGVQVLYTVLTQSDRGHSEVVCWNEGWGQPVRLGGRLSLLEPLPVAGTSARPALVATAMVFDSLLTTYRVTWLQRSPTPPCTRGRTRVPCPE